MPHRRNALTDDQLNWNNWIPFRLLENSFHVPSLLAIDVIFVLGHWYFKLYIAFFSVRFEVIVSPNLNSTYVNKKTIIRVLFIFLFWECLHFQWNPMKRFHNQTCHRHSLNFLFRLQNMELYSLTDIISEHSLKSKKDDTEFLIYSKLVSKISYLFQYAIGQSHYWMQKFPLCSGIWQKWNP